MTAVAARSASAGVKPRSSTKISISRACHSPYGVTAKPESLPVIIGMPASGPGAGSRRRSRTRAARRRRALEPPARGPGEIDDVARKRERRADRAPAPEHGVDALVVEEVGVEDEIDPRPRGIEHGFAAARMHDHLSAEAVRFLTIALVSSWLKAAMSSPSGRRCTPSRAILMQSTPFLTWPRISSIASSRAGHQPPDGGVGHADPGRVPVGQALAVVR